MNKNWAPWLLIPVTVLALAVHDLATPDPPEKTTTARLIGQPLAKPRPAHTSPYNSYQEQLIRKYAASSVARHRKIVAAANPTPLNTDSSKKTKQKKDQAHKDQAKTVAAPTPPPAPQPPSWTPASECEAVSNPGPVYLTWQTKRWCPKVAYYLYRGQQLGAWQWKPGDLARNLLIIECESNGDPEVINPASGTTGLYQHRPQYWPERSAAAARLFGFTDPIINMGFDNIATGVWLYKTGGKGHWETCGGNWGGPVAATIRNMGY